MDTVRESKAPPDPFPFELQIHMAELSAGGARGMAVFQLPFPALGTNETVPRGIFRAAFCPYADIPGCFSPSGGGSHASCHTLSGQRVPFGVTTRGSVHLCAGPRGGHLIQQCMTCLRPPGAGLELVTFRVTARGPRLPRAFGGCCPPFCSV